MLTIRRAEMADIPTIMQFLEDHWLHGYILAHNREFFDWQFVHDDKVNVWIGIDDETGKMYAMYGAIIYSDSEYPDFSGILWVAIKSPDPMLAIDIQDAMWQGLSPRASFSFGLRPDAAKALELMGYSLISMDHYYRLSDIDEYKIAVITNKQIPNISDSGYKIVPIHSIEEMRSVIPEGTLLNSAPRKDYRYIKWRYFDHPIFRYDMWKILDNIGKPCAILITREEHANNRTSCKIVDFYGDSIVLGRITVALDDLMSNHNYEFIDIYSYGVPAEIYENAGFCRCDINSVNIIPNYFQPYTAENAGIHLVPIEIPGTRLFRGDSDQDKPRL